MNIIETKNLRFQYKNQIVLDGIDLSIPSGSIYGYLGKNGAGKTTSLKLLLGLLDAKPNSIFFFNKEFHKNRLEILHSVGNLIENPSFYESLTGFENLKYLELIYGFGNQRIEHVLELCGLKVARNKKVKKYSLGMKQRLGIAMAILHNPDILILDEPLNGLDPEGVHEVREMILTLKKEGKTILLSSHILSEIEKICTHIGILDNGKIRYQGNIDTLMATIKREIIIKTNSVKTAENICRTYSLPCKIISENQISIESENDEHYNWIIKTLIQNNIEIYAIDSQENSLESIFLNLISRQQ